MKVAILTLNRTHGGVETLIKQHQKFFSADVFICGGVNLPEKCPFKGMYLPDSPLSRKVLAKRLKDYDVVMYHWPSAWAVQAVKESGTPSVEVIHTEHTLSMDKSVPTLIVSHSKFLGEMMHARCGRDFIVIPNSIDLSLFQDKPGVDLLGGITTYHCFKNVDIALEAARLLSPRRNFRYYGGGPDREKLQKKYGDQHTDLRGPVSPPEKYWGEFSMCVQSATMEGLPITTLEALACNMPVVASDIPGIVEFNRLAIERGEEPPIDVFKVGNPTALAQVIERTAKEKEGKKLNVRSYIERYYSTENSCAAYAAALSSVCGAKL